MNCERCNERQAKVHSTEVLPDGERLEEHLCEECYRERNESSGDAPEVLGMLSAAILPKEATAGTGGASGEAGSGASLTGGAPAALQCDGCGLGYREFRARGRLGCSRCYTVFAKPLEPLLEKIHGGTRHVGKAPDVAGTGGEVERRRGEERRLVKLRREMHKAVREERYEDAARLRDRLADQSPGDEPASDEQTGDRAAADAEAGG